MQYPHHFKKMVGCNILIMFTLNLLIFFARFLINSIPNLDLASQEFPPPMQDEHGDVMEENEWVHEGSRGCCKVNACTSFYVAKCLFHRHLDQTHGLQMQLGDLSIHLFVLGVLGDKTTLLWMLNNPHAKQKWNEKKAIDQVKNKKRI